MERPLVTSEKTSEAVVMGLWYFAIMTPRHRTLFILILGAILGGGFVAPAEAHESRSLRAEEIEGQLVREFLAFRHLLNRDLSPQRGDRSKTVEERVKRFRTYLGNRLACRWQDSTDQYLRLTGTAYEQGAGKGENSFHILPSKEGSWLNQMARELWKDGVDLVLRPEVAKECYLGSYDDLSREMELVLPPIPATPMDIVGHEGVHLVVVQGRYRGFPHVYSGHILSRNPGLAASYSELDLSEVGGFVETLLVDVGSRSHPASDSSLLLGTVQRDLRYLAMITKEIDDYLQKGLRLSDRKISVIRFQDSPQLSLYFTPFLGTASHLSNFASVAEINLNGIAPTSSHFPEDSWSLADLAVDDSRVLRRRLGKLADFYQQINQQVLQMQKEFSGTSNYDDLQHELLDLKARLRHLNIQWLQELNLPPGHRSWRMDSRVESLSRLHLDCQLALGTPPRRESGARKRTSP